jgi:hypothetical protein
MGLAQSFAGLAPMRHQGVLGAALLIFVAGFMAGAIVRPVRPLPLPSAATIDGSQATLSDAALSQSAVTQPRGGLTARLSGRGAARDRRRYF